MSFSDAIKTIRSSMQCEQGVLWCDVSGGCDGDGDDGDDSADVRDDGDDGADVGDDDDDGADVGDDNDDDDDGW